MAASYGAGHVRVFGSVARGVERADSDTDLPRSETAGMRDHPAHRCFGTTHAIVASTVAQDLPD
ncbi:hypothetical protein DQ238_19165 [Geodermatophilus sp. TF02-6]|uniref:hypothetical protein n=1 Tax=Geodermatophilus sp. TF02-6 TaxID=2250575 RepID=UPI000DE85D04|nr:hypothetical protein [Geodermatophilus sp. TF02-6]RBY75750.1 hypothetical protein DQ238_19165 [Geodermatophilus sp. TF02-6]